MLVLATVRNEAGALHLLAGAGAGVLGWGLAIWLQQHPLASFLRRAAWQR
jgi:hypothetical protein